MNVLQVPVLTEEFALTRLTDTCANVPLDIMESTAMEVSIRPN